MINKNLNVYLLAFITILIINCLYQFPSLLDNPQLIQDGGVNFVKNYLKYGFYSIALPDAGYFPLFQRLISLTVFEILPIRSYPFGINLSALLICSFAASCFVINIFNPVIKSLCIRFIFAIFIGTWPDFQTHLIENIGLFLYIPIIGILLYRPKNIFQVYLLSFFGFIMTISKPQLIGVGIVAFYSILNIIIKKNKCIYLIPPLLIFLATSVQSIYILYVGRDLWISDGLANNFYTFVNFLYNIPHNVFHINQSKIYINLFDNIYWSAVALYLFYLILFVGINIKKINISFIYFFLLFISSVFIYARVSITPPHIYMEQNFIYDRYSFVIFTSFLILNLSVIFNNKFSLSIVNYVFKIFLSVGISILIIINIIKSKDFPAINNFSDWHGFTSFYDSVDISEPNNFIRDDFYSNNFIKNLLFNSSINKNFVTPVDSINSNQHWLLSLGPDYINAKNKYGTSLQLLSPLPQSTYSFYSSNSKGIKVTHVFILLDDTDKNINFGMTIFADGISEPVKQIPSNNKNWIYFYCPTKLSSSFTLSFKNMNTGKAEIISNKIFIIGYGDIK